MRNKMHTDIYNYASTDELISHLSKNDKIIGIVEYGTRKVNEMSMGGDYDISIFLERDISNNINGVHFHIDSIPVDCMILSITELEKDKPSNPLLLAHIGATILYDKNGRTQKALEHINKTWNKIVPLEDWEINFYRFFFKHTLDKIRNRLHNDIVFSNYSIALAETTLIDAYERINSLEPGKPRKVLEHMRNNDPELYAMIEAMQTSPDIEKKIYRPKRRSRKNIGKIQWNLERQRITVSFKTWW
jgi:hypothetical protein